MPNYKVTEIEGIGPVYSAKLEQAGIKTVNDILEKGKSVKGRKALAESTGIDAKLILKWVNMGDLFRVKGIGINRDYQRIDGSVVIIDCHAGRGVHCFNSTRWYRPVVAGLAG